MSGRAIACLLILAAAARAAAAGVSPTHPDATAGKPSHPVPVPAREIDDRGYDCLAVRLDLTLDFNGHSILGRARHTLRATAPLSVVRMDLIDSLRVLGVWRDAAPATFQHAARTLTIDMNPPLAPGEADDLTIIYKGRPPYDGLLGFQFQTHNGVPAAFTLSEPTSASAWWPCKDVPDDKLEATVVLDVPDTLYAGSNGSLVADEIAGGRRRMTWHESRPIAPYLVSVACTNYSILCGSHQGPDGRILPLLYLAYPEDSAHAAASWAGTPQMIVAFEQRFGPYPFYGEKYGMAEFNWPGGMENQTLTSYGQYLVDGKRGNDWVVAHELAHQWWGDKVTLASWDQMWLNEGFASYAEALWYESVGGAGAYRDWMRSEWSDSFDGPIVPPHYLFSATVYFKGAWVLHMLRGVLGDAVFFDALRLYEERHAFANATTDDLVRACEDVSGRDLGWFFDRWIYGTGQPAYDMTWSFVPGPGAPALELTITQTQAEAPFRMPIPIELTDVHGIRTVTLDDSLRSQEFSVPQDVLPFRVRLDPDDWILKTTLGGSGVADLPAPEEGPGIPYPSPGRPPFTVRVPARMSGGALEVLDPAGRRLAWVRVAPGASAVTWDGRDAGGRDLPSGLYLLRAAGAGTDPARRVWLLR